MALTINSMTNTAALANLSMNSANSSKSLGSIASGLRLNSAADGAAGLAISNQLSAQVRGMGQAIMNSNDTIGMLQTADGAMSGINDNMQRIRTLTLQASNDTMSSDDRAAIQKEINSLMESSNDIANQTSYNGTKLLDGTGGSTGDGTFVTQTGPDSGDTQSTQIGNATTSSLLGGATIDVTTAAGRASALNTVDSAIGNISDIRSTLGASQNQLYSNIKNMSLTQVNTAAAESGMRDLDFAQESANFSSANLLTQIGLFAQSQASNPVTNAMQLLR